MTIDFSTVADQALVCFLVLGRRIDASRFCAITASQPYGRRAAALFVIRQMARGQSCAGLANKRIDLSALRAATHPRRWTDKRTLPEETGHVRGS
jgi:hypothetical protein